MFNIEEKTLINNIHISSNLMVLQNNIAVNRLQQSTSRLILKLNIHHIQKNNCTNNFHHRTIRNIIRN